MLVDLVLAGLLFCTVYLYFFLQHLDKKTGKRLPGPPSIPIFGSLPFLLPYLFGKHNYEMCREVAKKYGPIFGVQIGLFYHIVCEDVTIAKEIMASEDWKQRNSNHAVFFERSYNKPLGVLIGTDAGGYKEVRKFTSKILRQFGLSKRENFEASLRTEASFIVKSFQDQIDPKTGTGVVDMQHFFHIPSLNVLWNIMCASRFAADDVNLKSLLGLIHDVSKACRTGMRPVFAFPMLRYLPYVTDHDDLLYTHYKVQQLYKKIIDERRSKGLYKSEPNSFVEIFIKEIDDRQEKSDGMDTVYTDEQLITIGVDLFMTGSDTTSTALEFAIQYMLRNPLVQKQVQEEIDRVIGKDRNGILDDRVNMPYTEATICEIMRWTSLVPLAIRTALKDGLTINGVPIKKETMIGINLHSIHFSEELWEDPLAFRPERFLNDKMELINQHKVLAFGFGKRACIGDWLAKATFFVFFVTALQKFEFSLVPGQPEPKWKTDSGIARYPKKFFALVKERGSRHEVKARG